MSTSIELTAQKRELLITLLRGSVANAQRELEIAKLQLHEAQQKMEAAEKNYNEHKELLDTAAIHFGIEYIREKIDSDPQYHTRYRYKIRPNLINNVAKRRETVESTTLRLIRDAAKFKAFDQIRILVFAEYGDGEITEKTVKNALWKLSRESVRKFYSKERRTYLYGLNEWFDDNDNPKPEHIEIELVYDLDSGTLFSGDAKEKSTAAPTTVDQN